MINTKKPNFMRATTQMLNMVAGLPPYYILHKKTQTRNCCRIGYISSGKNITEQDQIKIQGEVASNIINKIANAKVNIKQKSLRESIINDIVKANETHPYSRLATTLLPIFRGGVYLPRSIYSQQRVEIGSNQNKTMFCPTVLVTQQIFQRCLNSWKKSSTPEIFYGLFGASKTFSFILYGLLSSFVSKAAYKNLIAQSLFVPKLVYFTIDPENLAQKLSGFSKKHSSLLKHQIYQKLGLQQVQECLYYQCPELYKELPKEQHQDKVIQNSDIKKYEQKGIKTIFLVDQINTVASYVRRKMNGQIKPGQDQKSYQLCMKMNEARKNYTRSFSKIILNSSYNFQFYDRKIIHEVGVTKQEKHSYLNQRNFGKLSYLERFSNNKEQTLLSLTDLIIFNIEDLIIQVPQTIDGINVRNIVYKIIMENQDQIFATPLGIRNAILKIEQDATLKQNLVKSIQNIDQFTEQMTILVHNIIKQMKSFYKNKIVHFVNKQPKYKQVRISLMWLVYLKCMNEENRENTKDLIIKLSEVKKYMPVSGDGFQQIARQNRLDQYFDNNFVYIDDDKNIKLIMPVQYLRILLRNYKELFSHFALTQRSAKYQKPIIRGAQGDIFQNYFWLQVSEGNDIQFSVKRNGNQEEMLIDDHIFGMKSFNKQSKGDGLIKRLQKMLNIMQTIQVEKKYFLVVQLQSEKLQNRENKRKFGYKKVKDILVSLIYKDNIIDQMTSNAKTFDFMIIQKSKDAIKIHAFDFTKLKKTQLQNKIISMDDFEQDYVNDYLKSQKLNQKYSIEFYKYFVTPWQQSQATFKFQKGEDGRLKKINKQTKQSQQIEIKVPMIKAQNFIKSNTSQSLMKGQFKRFAMRLVKNQMEKVKNQMEKINDQIK